MQNFWWHGIALMEAAATRACTAIRPRRRAISSRCSTTGTGSGDWSQQWLNLRYVTRFLVRVGADDDAVTLHRALVNAGKPSPLNATQLAVLAERSGGDRFDGLSGAAAVARARSSLDRYA